MIFLDSTNIHNFYGKFDFRYLKINNKIKNTQRK